MEKRIHHCTVVSGAFRRKGQVTKEKDTLLHMNNHSCLNLPDTSIEVINVSVLVKQETLKAQAGPSTDYCLAPCKVLVPSCFYMPKLVSVH